MYTAAVLRPDSAMKLKTAMRANLDLERLGFVCETPNGDPLPHHMTINLGAFNESLNPKDTLGKSVIITVSTLRWCEDLGACAASVDSAICDEKRINSSNVFPHITICLKPPTKPVKSNELLGAKGFIFLEPLILHAVIEEVQ